MKIKHLLLSAALVGLIPMAAQANSESSKGVYVSLGGGVSMLEKSDLKVGRLKGKAEFDAAYSLVGAVGYKFSHGFRLEFEGAYRHSKLKSSTLGGTDFDDKSQATIGRKDRNKNHYDALSAMANLVYERDLGGVMPYIGGGVGIARVGLKQSTRLGPIEDQDTVLAYQGIAGVAVGVTENIKLDLGYRYFNTARPSFTIGDPPNGAKIQDQYGAHSLLLSVRYEFGAPPPPPPVVPAAGVAVPPPPPPPPAPSMQRAFIVFFDFDRSDITPEAARIIRQAAESAKRGSVARIYVTGHTDLAGSVAYNQRLSERRAEAVRQALIREGLTTTNITTIGRGKSDPLVPTADGVREPQNRRAEIAFQ